VRAQYPRAVALLHGTAAPRQSRTAHGRAMRLRRNAEFSRFFHTKTLRVLAEFIQFD